MPRYSTLLYSSPPYSILPHPHPTLLFLTLLYSTISQLYSTISHPTLLYSTLPHPTLLYSTQLYYFSPYSCLFLCLLINFFAQEQAQAFHVAMNGNLTGATHGLPTTGTLLYSTLMHLNLTSPLSLYSIVSKLI